MANTQLSADHAVIFPELPDSSPLDYLQAIGAIIGSSHIHSFYNTDGFIKIYLKERIHLEKVSKSGIFVLGHHLQANDVESSLLKITLSGVDPIVPDSYLEELLKSYGTLETSITHPKVFEDESFSHIDSGVRYVELKIFKGVVIPTTIQVQYKDILCAVDVKVEKENLLKKSIGVRSSRKKVYPNGDVLTDLENSTTNDAKSSKESAYEFISQSAETVKINPRRSVKKVANCGESASVSSNTLTQNANGVISSTSAHAEDLASDVRRNIDHPSGQYLSINNAINICDLSLPKSAENRYNYLNGKQRLKSDKVLNELISKNFFPFNSGGSPTASGQPALHFSVTRNRRINALRYPKIKSDKKNQKKSVISELLSIHGRERQLAKKVNSCTVNSICDIQQVNTPHTIVWSRIQQNINNRLDIELLPSDAVSVPKEVSKTKRTFTNKPVHLQKLTKSSKEKSTNKKLKLKPESSSTNSVHCSNISTFNFEQDLSNSNFTRRLRPRSKTNTLNPASTCKNNESSDTFIILPDTSGNSEYFNSSGLDVYNKTISCVSQQDLPSCSKTYKTRKRKKEDLKSVEIFQSKFKKVENQRPMPVLPQGIPGNEVHSPLQKPTSKATYLKTATTLEQSNAYFDTLPQASESSKCLDWISHSNEKILKDSKKRQSVLKYEGQKKLSHAKTSETRKNRKPSSVFSQDVACNNVVHDKEKSQNPKLNGNSTHIEKTSAAKYTMQQKRSQYKFKNVKTNINHKPPVALTQNIVSNEVPNLLLDNQTSQHLDQRTDSNCSKSKVLDKKPVTNQQSYSRGSSIHRKRETWNSISAAAKNIARLDDASSLFPKKKSHQDPDLNANSKKEELNGFGKIQSDTLCLNQTTSSPSDSKPEVTSIALNSKPTTTDAQPNSMSTKEKSEFPEQTVNFGSDKSNDFDKNAIKISNRDTLPTNSKNEKMGGRLDSLPITNATGSDKGPSLSSNEESLYTDFNNVCISSPKDFDKLQSDTRSTNQENLPFITLSNDTKHSSKINYTSDLVQDAASCDALSISLSKEQSSKALDQINDKSNNFNKLPSNNQYESQQDNSQSNSMEDEKNISLDSQAQLPTHAMSSDSSSSKDFCKKSSGIQTIKQPDILQFIPKKDKTNDDTNLNLRTNLPLDSASCDADMLSNKDISRDFDLNSTSSNNTSKDLNNPFSGSVNQENTLQCSTVDKINVTSDSAPVSDQNIDATTSCPSLPNKDILQCIDVLINDMSVNIAKEQLDTQSSNLEKTLNTCSILDETEKVLNPVIAQCMKASDALPNLLPSNKNPKSMFQKNSSSDCKSTDYDLGHSNSPSENLKHIPIITESIKPPKIGVCLPIPQCPTNSSGFRSLNFNQNFTYKRCVNPQKIAKSNNEKDKTNMLLNSTSVFPQNVQTTSGIPHNKVCQDPNLTSGISNKSEMYVRQCYSNSQRKSSQKKSEYGIRSIFYNSKTNSSGNRNKNKKVVRKRKMKSKAKTAKVNVTSSRNSGQNKGCFSEYEFNSSDSDSKDISYSKWRSQKQTPKKRFRSSSLDDVNSTVFPTSGASNSTNVLPYDLSMKSKKLSPTIVNTARYDYNTLIRKKRERLDAICRRVSLINKGNLSNKPLLTCEKEKTVGNISNHILSVPSFAVNKTRAETQESLECPSRGLNVSNSQFIPKAISSNVLPLNVPRVECNPNSLNLTSTTVLENNKETTHDRHQVFESKDSIQLKNSSNYKSTIKSLQNKDFKKSLSQIHAKKVRKRMKKNTVRYMCLQNDGKKIVLKKVITPSDFNKSPIDLTNRTSEAASMAKETALSAGKELETNTEAHPVGLAAVVQDNLLVSQPTGNINFCLNGFSEQLANTNPQNTDVESISQTHALETKSLSSHNKTFVEHGVNNDFLLKDCFQLHMEATIKENIALVGKNVPNSPLKDSQSTFIANGSIEDLQSNIGISCSSSSTTNLVFSENLEVGKEVELSESQMDKPNEKFINDKNVTDESNCPTYKVPDRVIIKLESEDPEECIDGSVQHVVEDVCTNSQKSMAADAPHSILHLEEAQTSVSNVACVSDDNEDDAISSIKITEVYGSVILNPTYCDQTEKVPGGTILIIPGDYNLINNSACEPVCVNDSLNENLTLTSGTSETAEIIINKFPSDVHLKEKCSVNSLKNTICAPELRFVETQSDNDRSNNETCVEDIAFKQNGVNPEMDLNQNTIVSNHAENEKGSILVKCEQNQLDSVNCPATTLCTVVETSTHEVKELYEQGSSKVPSSGTSINNGNHQTVSSAVKLENKVALFSGKGHNGKASTSDSPIQEFPDLLNQGLSKQASLKSAANTGVSKIMHSPGGSVKVKKEKKSPSIAKDIVSTPKVHATKLSSSVKQKNISSTKLTQHNKNNKHVPVLKEDYGISSVDNTRKDVCTISTSVSNERSQVVKDISESKINHLQSTDSVRNQELTNSEGCYMIEKTEKPNTFRIFRQTSISSDNVSSTISSPIDHSIGQPVICSEKVHNNDELVKNDDKWGPYLAVAKDQSKVCANHSKKRKTSTKELSPKKKCFNTRLSVETINSNELSVVDNTSILLAEGIAGSSKQSSGYETFRSSGSIQQIEINSSNNLLTNDNADKNCDTDHSKNSAYTPSNSTISSTAGVSNTQHTNSPCVDLPSDTFIHPSDKTVAIESVRPKDIYSIYRNISQDCKSSARSVISFPLSKQRLNKFLQEARDHSHPRKLALKVLKSNKTPGALKELIVQLYDYFKVCNDRKEQLRVSRLIMLLDNRNK